jgi:hypothetical protein
MSVICRSGRFYLYKRVPRRFYAIETRRHIYISLKTDSLEVAKEKAPKVWREVLASWELIASGQLAEANERYELAKQLAQNMVVNFVTVGNVADLTIKDVVQRTKLVQPKKPQAKSTLAPAVLGGAVDRIPKISEALELFWDLSKPDVREKTADELRRWRNPRLKAFKNFINVVGDKSVSKLTADDMLNFREWLFERIEGGLSVSSANKDLIHVSSVLKKVNKMKRLN